MNFDHNLWQLELTLRKLNSTVQGRRAFLATLPVLLSACASGGKKSRYREGDNSGQQAALTVPEEERMTREYLPKMQKEYPALKDAYAQKYISELGQNIVQANGLHKKPYAYNFTLVDAKMVNAFALPAGTIYVTRPLFQMAESEAELAGVVGHEIGHVQARHTAERLYQAKKEESKSWLYGIGGAVLGGAAGFGLGKLLCSKQDRECLQRAALYGAAAGAGGGLLIQKFAFMANSREDEMEADRIGFRTSVAAGFHKDHVGNFYSKLLNMEKQYQKKQSNFLKPFTDAMSTHPPSESRVRQMNQMAANQPLQGRLISSPQFKQLKSRLK